MKINNKFVFIVFMMIISMFAFAGCDKSKDDDSEKQKVPTLSQSEMYNRFKTAYTNRNIYSGNYTEKHINSVDTGDSNNEIYLIKEVSYNSETNEGYVKIDSKLASMQNSKEEMYIVKDNSGYLNYYSSTSQADSYNDVFLVNDNYLKDKIGEEKQVEEYISKMNPNQYSGPDKYATALGRVILGNNTVLPVSKYVVKQNGYDCVFKIEYTLNESENNSLLLSISITYDDSTIKGYSFVKEQTYSDEEENSMTMTETLEYSKDYDLEGMNYDSSIFANKVPGDIVEIDYKVEIDSGFFNVTDNENIVAKNGESISSRMQLIGDYYKSTSDGGTFTGWYYDESCTNKVADDAKFIESLTLYAKVKIKQYDITKGSTSNNGDYSVTNSSTKNSIVTVYAYPNNGYVVSEMYYIEEGSSVRNYFIDSFTMPSKNVAVYVEFDTAYHIHTKDELITHLQNRNNWNKNFKLYNDIDLGGMEWTPVGDNISCFVGTFDGNNHVISNFKITKSAEYSGFFGQVLGGTIKNLGITNIQIKYENTGEKTAVFAGGLIGFVSSSNFASTKAMITNCFVTGEINIKTNDKTSIFVGGLIGRINYSDSLNYVTIESSYSNVNINVENKEKYLCSIGGIAGYSTLAVLKKNYALGNIVAEVNGEIAAGGLFGSTEYSEIKNNYSNSNVSIINKTSRAHSYIGGLIGIIDEDLIENNYSTGNVNLSSPNTESGYWAFVGGSIGCYTDNKISTIKNNYATGNVNVSAKYIAVAGGFTANDDTLFGENDENIKINNYKYIGQDVNSESEYEDGSFINIEETSASMDQIWNFVYNNWDSSIWNLSLTKNPTLKQN